MTLSPSSILPRQISQQYILSPSPFTSVQILFRPSSPSDVTFFVMSVIINPIESISNRPMSDPSNYMFV